MTDPGAESPLRLAPAESAEELARRFEREQRAVLRAREAHLTEATPGFRIGSVPYLNAAPLVRGLEDELIVAPPSQLAELLRRGDLDAALVSVSEVLARDAYDVLDGVAVASLGEVKSVFLAHRRPIESVDEVWCDPASLTSVALLQVLFGERGLRPAIKPLPGYAAAAQHDFVLLIGDPALAFLRQPHAHEIWDLGAAWLELTRLPFVYAVWALKRGVANEPLRRRLREAKRFGLETLDQIVATRTEFDIDFRRDYLTWHIHYHLGADEKRGLAMFMKLLERHGLGLVFAPRFVS
jgi:predicted solute-binding protein